MKLEATIYEVEAYGRVYRLITFQDHRFEVYWVVPVTGDDDDGNMELLSNGHAFIEDDQVDTFVREAV